MTLKIRAERLGDCPIITPHMDGRMGDNINGPSLIEVPEWLPGKLGRYYLYFAHHDGRYIRLAFADRLEGPWQTYEPGALSLTDSGFAGHIASPDVHVDKEERRIRLYFHGGDEASESDAPQFSRVAISHDGISFEARPEPLGNPYMRVMQIGEWYYAIAMPGLFYRSRDGLTGFEPGPRLFDDGMRHAALLRRDNRLLVFYSRIGDQPERILVSEFELSENWENWRASPPTTVLSPERNYEGANLELQTSVAGMAHSQLRELRDPGVFVVEDQTYLLYSTAGESGIALARLTIE